MPFLETGRPIGYDMLSDRFPPFARGNAKVLCYEEGLGCGDLMLDGYDWNSDFTDLLGKRRHQLYALTHRSGADIEGYEHTSGEGWDLYHDVSSEIDYAEFSRRGRLEFISQFET